VHTVKVINLCKWCTRFDAHFFSFCSFSFPSVAVAVSSIPLQTLSP